MNDPTMINYEDYDDSAFCHWCDEEFPTSDLKETNLGPICSQCLLAIKSRGEKVTITL